MATTTFPNLIPLETLPLRTVDELQACCPDLLTSEATISEEDAVLAARVFKALSDPARVRLLSMIASSEAREACVCDLTEPVGLSQPTVSHHLKVLHDAGLIDRERRASWVYYRLRPEAIAVVARALRV